VSLLSFLRLGSVYFFGYVLRGRLLASEVEPILVADKLHAGGQKFVHS
jgi:hypothetical protein